MNLECETLNLASECSSQATSSENTSSTSSENDDLSSSGSTATSSSPNNSFLELSQANSEETKPKRMRTNKINHGTGGKSFFSLVSRVDGTDSWNGENQKNSDPYGIIKKKSKGNLKKKACAGNNVNFEDEVVAEVLPNQSYEDVSTKNEKPETSSTPPKMRIKLSLRTEKSNVLNCEKKKLPKLKKKLSNQVENDVVATVIDNDQGVPYSPKPQQNSSCHNRNFVQVNNYAQPFRPIKIPPITSPGLLIMNTNSAVASLSNASKSVCITAVSPTLQQELSYAKQRDEEEEETSLNTVSKTITPREIFESTMSAAGYTEERRSQFPHRGSSVLREVGDLFDRDVMLTVNFPSLVPEWMIEEKHDEPKSEYTAKSVEMQSSIHISKIDTVVRSNGKTTARLFCETLSDFLKELSKSRVSGIDENKDDLKPRKRKGHQFVDMIPTSLTTNYASSYVNSYAAYSKEVSEREKVIISAQAANAKTEDEMLAYEEAKENWENKYRGSGNNESKDGTRQKQNQEILANSNESSKEMSQMPLPPKSRPKIEVPPIPAPPSPPELAVTPDIVSPRKSFTIPPEKRNLVAHLDPSFFLPSGRYHALQSNNIADPQFVGPNAPGLTGSNASSVSNGLATAQASSNSSSSSNGCGGSALSSAGILIGNGLSKDRNIAGINTTIPIKRGNGGNSWNQKKPSDKNQSNKGKSCKQMVGTFVNSDGIVITGTNLELKKILAKGDSFAEHMRISLIKAAIYACETSTEGGPWQAYNGEIFPDISKAFAMHGGLRPCPRCKSNKQGAYHCRLRRKHKDLDYDGRNSVAILDTINNTTYTDGSGKTVGPKPQKLK